MTVFATEPSGAGERRVRVLGDRVACWRIGSVDLDRCRECVYLVRLQQTGARNPRPGYVVCADAAPDQELEVAW